MERDEEELNLIHIGQRPDGFDLEEFAHEELESAKRSLQEEGYLTAIAWIVTSDEVHVFAPGFHNQEQKYQVYGKLVERAKELRAKAIMILNDTRYVLNPDMAAFYEGKVTFEGAKEALIVIISGPGIKSKELSAQYERIGDRIVFAPTKETSDVTPGLLGSWSQEMRKIQ